jgi:glycosyltransferase involved in cell wall biosynthesis
MRILVHDYSGHPFQVELSRALARRSHAVLHLHAAFFQTPKADLLRQPCDPPGFSIEGLELGEPFAKYRFLLRRAQEQAYGALISGRTAAWRPDLVLCANTPLDPLAAYQAWCRSQRIPFVLWLQDIYSLAIDRTLRRSLGWPGAVIGRHYRSLERRVACRSDAVVAITEDFRPVLARWGVAADRLFVIENWAPLGGLRTAPRDNDWSEAHGLAGKTVLLYTGTLGLKHNPRLITAIAEHFRADQRIAIVVVSEGLGADWLARRKAEQALGNLHLLPYQAFSRLAEVMATGDVLIAILEPDAGVFSVPSKVLSYFCASRPILAAIPSANLAARVISGAGAGLVVDPADEAGFVAAAERLIGDPPLRSSLGKNALDYARKAFDIGAIVAKFEKVFSRALAERPPQHG